MTGAYSAWLLATGSIPSYASIRIPSLEVEDLAKTLTVIGLGTAVGSGVTQVPAAGFSLGVLAGIIMVTARALRRAHKREQLMEHWPDFLAVLRSRLSAGSPLEESFISSGRHLGGHFDPWTDHIEERLAAGSRFDDALASLRTRVADPLADRVLTTIATASRTGGGMVAGIVSRLGVSISDELRLRKAHEAALTQQRLTALVALVAPWALLALTMATNPRSAALYRTRTGTTIIAVGLVATSAGYLLARRSARLSRPPRIFS